MAFPAFQLLYITLAVDKMNGCGLSHTAYYNACHSELEKYYPKVAMRQKAAVVKVSGWMYSDAFKGRLAFDNFSLK